MTESQNNPTPVQQGDEEVVNIPAENVPPGQTMAPPQTHERAGAVLKVHGVDTEVSYEGLVTAAQKGMAADENFQSAAAETKKAESALQFQEDMQLVATSGDVNAFRRAGAALGIPGNRLEQTAEFIEKNFASEGASQNASDPNIGPSIPPTDGKIAADWAKEIAALKAQIDGKQVSLGNLSPDIQKALISVEEQRISGIIQKSLDKDPTLSYYMGRNEGKGRDAIRGMIQDKIKGRLNASDGRFGDGVAIMGAVLPEVRTLLDAVETPERSIPPVGLGPAPGGSGPSIYPAKEPEHVSSTESNFEEHILELLAHNERKAQG